MRNMRTTVAASIPAKTKGKYSIVPTTIDEVQRLRDELAVNLHKLQSVLSETESALRGFFQLPQPDFLLPTVEDCERGLNRATFEMFKALIDSWSEL